MQNSGCQNRSNIACQHFNRHLRHDHCGKSACQLFNGTWDIYISKGNIGNPSQGCKLVQFAAQPNDQYRSRSNLWTRPCQPFNVKLDNSHLGGSKRVYFGAKFNNPGLSFDNGTHPRLAASPQFAVRGRGWRMNI